jgi:hypothetical protein
VGTLISTLFAWALFLPSTARGTLLSKLGPNRPLLMSTLVAQRVLNSERHRLLIRQVLTILVAWSFKGVACFF